MKKANDWSKNFQYLRVSETYKFVLRGGFLKWNYSKLILE